MSRAPQDDAGQRDKALAKLLADALEPRATSGHAAEGTGAENPDCPDPEALAAYADRGLDPQEAARLEEHVAECGRCTSILAVLTNMSAEPLAAREAPPVREAGAGWAHTSRASKHRAGIGSQLLARWRWIAPAVGVAAAAAVWFVLRPMPHEVLPPPQLSAQNTTRESRRPQPLDSVSPKVSKPRSDAPRPNALEKRRETRAPAAQLTDELSTSARGKDALSDSSSAQNGRLPRASSTTPGASNGATSGATPPAEPAAPSAYDNQAETAAPAASPTMNRATAMALIQPVIFGSPDGKALWRLGVSGRIERSTDRGQTWQLQASPVTTDLLAGVAASQKVGWIVGRAGVILRTIDGTHWQRIPPPATVPLDKNEGAAGDATGTRATAGTDWTAVEARDALHATIVSDDLQHFSTEDGGRTWSQQ